MKSSLAKKDISGVEYVQRTLSSQDYRYKHRRLQTAKICRAVTVQSVFSKESN